MLIVAHRGFSGRYPENTLLAFQKAIEAGCDGIELDVHATKDGVPIICHDETIDRTTNGSGRLCDFTLAELRQFDAYGGFKGQYPRQVLPTFEEYCALVESLPIFTNIEIKTDNYYYPQLVEQVLAIIRAHHLEHKVLFSSFNPATILRCKQLEPMIPCGFLCDKPIGNAGAFVRDFGVEYLHPNLDKMTAADYQACAAYGVGINGWTLNNSATPLEELCKLPLIALITNWPDRAKALVED